MGDSYGGNPYAPVETDAPVIPTTTQTTTTTATSTTTMTSTTADAAVNSRRIRGRPERRKFKI